MNWVSKCEWESDIQRRHVCWGVRVFQARENGISETAQHKTANSTGWSEGRISVSWDQLQCSSRSGDQIEVSPQGQGSKEKMTLSSRQAVKRLSTCSRNRTIEKTESSSSIKCPLELRSNS